MPLVHHSDLRPTVVARSMDDVEARGVGEISVLTFKNRGEGQASFCPLHVFFDFAKPVTAFLLMPALTGALRAGGRLVWWLALIQSGGDWAFLLPKLECAVKPEKLLMEGA